MRETYSTNDVYISDDEENDTQAVSGAAPLVATPLEPPPPGVTMQGLDGPKTVSRIKDVKMEYVVLH